MFNVTWTAPCIAVRGVRANVGRIGQWGDTTIQMPVIVAKIALEHLALIATRFATLNAKYGLVLRRLLEIIGSLCAIPATLRSILHQYPFDGMCEAELTVGIALSYHSKTRRA